MSDYKYNNTYGLIKRFRHNEEYSFRPQKTYWTKFLLDKQERTILGHKPLRWGSIILFYIVFFTALAFFICICWYAFVLTIGADAPTAAQKQPGVSSQPYGNIEYDVKSFEHVDFYASGITSFLSKYGDVTELFGAAEGCSPIDDYGYPSKKPCIFLKINKIYGFKAEPYKSASELPSSAPAQLREAITANNDVAAKGRVWVSCESDLAKEPTYKYFPATQSVPISLVNVNELENPEKLYDIKDIGRVVAVQISDIPLDKVIHFKCYFWAKNIEQDEEAKYGNTYGKGFLKIRMKITDKLV